MKSLRDPDFNKLFACLPPHVQELARKAYRQWQQDRWHPSLRFKPAGDSVWSARVTKGYRALAEEQSDGTFLWYWIGSHNAYDKRLREKR